MKKLLLVCLLLAGSVSSLFAVDYYWVGGAGSWTDINHWATTSGGTTKHSIVPSQNDNVFFDANSGLANGDIVTLPATSDAFCNNMSWTGVTATASFRRGGGGFAINIYGNLVLAPSVAYGMQSIFLLGTQNTTVQCNGAVRVNATGWYNPMVVNKPGASVTFLDGIPELLQVTVLQAAAGTIVLSGNTHYIWKLDAFNNNTATIDISNATINISDVWDVRGTNKTIITTNSVINANTMFSDGYAYNEVNISIASTNVAINNTTINKLTFTNPASAPATVRINGNNTIQTLEFKGNGLIRAGGNVINDLIMASGKALLTYGDNTINGSFSFNTPDCSGLGQLTGAAGQTSTLTFGSSAVLDLVNLYITNIVAAGSITLPIDVVGADGGSNTNWNITNPLTGTTLYWVGGAGDWNDKAHWSASSGGAGGYCVPFSADDVVFDANSGFAPGNNTVTTTSNAWCKDMTWTGIASPVIFNESGTYALEVYGSVVLHPDVTMNASLLFKGTAASTLTTNASGLGTLGIEISRTGTNGGVTLTDDFVNPTANVRLILGQWLMPGRTLDVNFFNSGVNGIRTIDMTNATINVRETFALTGNGRTWIGNGAGLSITSARYFNVAGPGLTIPTVTLTSAEDVFDIRNVTIETLTFTNTASNSNARILTNNIITTLEFKGSGNIAQTGNTIGTLLLAPSKYYGFTGTNTINTHLRFNSPACSGLGEMRGINGVLSTLNFGPSATTDLANVYIQNIAATGSITPITVSGADAGGNSGFVINSSAGSARYWVGGSGDWNDASHWSLTSGGAGGACVPTVNDDVFFDAQSFTAGSSTVTTAGNIYANNMDWTGATNAPVFNESTAFTFEIWGNLVMNPAVTMNATAVFMGGTNTTITNNGSTLGNFDITVNKPNTSFSLTLNDDINNPLSFFNVQSGALNVANRTLVLEGISDEGSANATAIDISNTTFTGGWRYNGSSKTLNATNSFMTVSAFLVNSGVYNKVNVNTQNPAFVGVTNTTVSKLVFTNTNPLANINIAAGNTIDTLEFKSKGNITGTGNTIGTMIFAPGRQYTFANGTNTTVTNAWYGSGTPCNLTDISAATNATVTVNGDPVNLDYVRLSGITAAGSAAPFHAFEHSQDQGGNTNWTIDPYAGSNPILGLGPDITITTDELPFVLRTDGFFGSPMSSYLWNDNSTGDTLEITAAGTYSVTVSFPDGCSSPDEIVVTVVDPLPITLTSFMVKSVNCAPVLSWSTADAINFHRFEVERSADGRNFQPIGSISFNASVSRYSYIDDKAGEGRFFYRLRLVDIDNKYEFSNIVSLSNNCGGILEVIPTVTADLVQVTLPGGYENARIRVFSANGQEMSARLSGNGSRKTVDLSSFAKGYYFVQVNNGVEMKTFKVMKK
ncbi:T9SS type A sorting domain-containing protein [Pseudoflavitalea rhizosphaerae]|uniref:T9SS type A sorting domain-containing protein n=1 Tax=Pseudoflavitalea rhizosphaerae TaxID=1884793 RepID=UPI000F8CD084|nr:T9SS type A sorting domain-containing protein [Pseudoflavitalea rhizosphaerae]